MTSSARQAAYDAADKVTTISRRHVEAIVDAALNALAGDLHIAPDPGLPPGFSAVWAPGMEEWQAHELHVRGPVWALLEAVIPTRDEE